MSNDRSLARCSFCGRRPPEVHRMVAGPGAAYICEACLQLCNEILHESAPFSAKALELAARPPVVIAAPHEWEKTEVTSPPEPLRTILVEREQKQRGMVLMLHQLLFYQNHFELHYLWIRPPFTAGFAFVPRIIFYVKDNTGTQWKGDQGGMLLARPELVSDPNQAIYQGSARFRPLPSPDARTLNILASDPLGQFDDPAAGPGIVFGQGEKNSGTSLWQFDITL